MADFVRCSVIDGVAVLEIDNPPVNALSPGVPEALQSAIGAVARDPAVSAVVIRGCGRTFVAGADITTLECAAWGDEDAAPDFHDLFQCIEDCRKPVVVALHGSALGGGLELALAGHYRIGSRDAQVGLPEVNLGVMPGGEGTQRLPRLAGVDTALALCVSGRALSAAEALAAGILDEVADADLTTAAVALARRVAGREPPRTRTRDDRLGTPAVNAPLVAAARALAATERRHQVAPRRAIDAIEAAAVLPFDEGCRRERQLFFECLRGEQAKAMIHVFFAVRALRKRADALDVDAIARQLAAARTSAERSLLAQGATRDRIDGALADFGWPGETSGQTGAGSAVSDQEITERVVYATSNAAAGLLDGDRALRASDLDAISVERLGFPAWRGGPLFHADRVGLSAVLDRITRFQGQRDGSWQPAPRLVALAKSRGTFREHDRARRA